MINIIEIENQLQSGLSKELTSIDELRHELMAKGQRNKLYFLIFLLAVLGYGYIEILIDETGYIGDIVFGTLSIIVLLIYIFSKPQSFISGNNLRTFYNQAKKDVFQKSIGILDSSADYRPLYKTHLSHINKSGFFGKGFVVSKEDDGIILNRKQSKACISELHVYRGTKKIFRGLFVVITLSSKELNVKEEFSEIISSFKNHITSTGDYKVQEFLNSNTLYLSLDLKSDFLELAISDKKRITYESIESDLKILCSLVQLFDQLSIKSPSLI